MSIVEVTQTVTNSMIDTLSQLGMFVEKSNNVPLNTNEVVHIQIDLNGTKNGYLILELKQDYACSLANIMLAGMMTVTEVDDMCMSVLGELSNMLSGNVCTSLSNLGMSLDITPPKVTIVNKELDCDKAICLKNKESNILNTYILML